MMSLMNVRQLVALVLGLAAIVVVLLFPPYSLSSGLIGGEVYSYFRDPPQLMPSADYRDTFLQGIEVFTILVFTATALIALRRNAPRRQKTAALVGGLLAAALLAFGLASVNSVSGGPPWPILAGLGQIILALVLVPTSTGEGARRGQ